MCTAASLIVHHHDHEQNKPKKLSLRDLIACAQSQSEFSGTLSHAIKSVLLELFKR